MQCVQGRYARDVPGTGSPSALVCGILEQQHAVWTRLLSAYYVDSVPSYLYTGAPVILTCFGYECY